jgi:uncharacterized membrane protein YvbJ
VRQAIMKRCPYCDGKIQDRDIVCRYCGEDLAKTLPLEKRVETQRKKQKANDRKAAIGFVTVACILMMLYIVFSILVWYSF